jgi:hypothetical protein
VFTDSPLSNESICHNTYLQLRAFPNKRTEGLLCATEVGMIVQPKKASIIAGKFLMDRLTIHTILNGTVPFLFHIFLPFCCFNKKCKFCPVFNKNYKYTWNKENIPVSDRWVQIFF